MNCYGVQLVLGRLPGLGREPVRLGKHLSVSVNHILADLPNLLPHRLVQILPYIQPPETVAEHTARTRISPCLIRGHLRQSIKLHILLDILAIRSLVQILHAAQQNIHQDFVPQCLSVLLREEGVEFLQRTRLQNIDPLSLAPAIPLHDLCQRIVRGHLTDLIHCDRIDRPLKIGRILRLH